MGDIYEEHFQTVFKYLYSLTLDQELSEELTQETFYQALKTYANFRGESKVSVWLCQIAKRLWYKEYTRRNHHTKNSMDEMADQLPGNLDVEDYVVDNTSKISLYQKLQKLDENTREVMYLRLTGELSFRDIGEILNKNETWARVTFYRGKQKLIKEESDV